MLTRAIIIPMLLALGLVGSACLAGPPVARIEAAEPVLPADANAAARPRGRPAARTGLGIG